MSKEIESGRAKNIAAAIANQLAATTTKNDNAKLDILQSEKHNSGLRRHVYMTSAVAINCNEPLIFEEVRG